MFGHICHTLDALLENQIRVHTSKRDPCLLAIKASLYHMAVNVYNTAIPYDNIIQKKTKQELACLLENKKWLSVWSYNPNIDARLFNVFAKSLLMKFFC